MNLSDKILYVLRYEKTEITKEDFNVSSIYFFSSINNLVRKGFVEKMVNPKDIRKRIYKLSPKGKNSKTVAGLF